MPPSSSQRAPLISSSSKWSTAVAVTRLTLSIIVHLLQVGLIAEPPGLRQSARAVGTFVGAVEVDFVQIRGLFADACNAFSTVIRSGRAMPTIAVSSVMRA